MRPGILLLGVVTILAVSRGNGECADLFHAGWTGRCEGCHGYVTGAANLTASEICLRCHAAASPRDYQVATYPFPPPGSPPAALTPAGDFAYLRKSYYWNEPTGEQATSPGERHGHNIIAPAYGFMQDMTLPTAPGGSYPSDILSCVSCHDPHGNYRIVDEGGTIATSGNPIVSSGSYGDLPTATEAVGSYRLLAGKGYRTKSYDNPFQYDPPLTVAPRNYNRPETYTDTRVAYGKGTTEWCANCHEQILTNGNAAGHIHPAGVELGDTVAGMYNRYLKTGDLNGSRLNAFTSLVPYQSSDTTGIAQLAQLTVSTAGPGPSDKVTCLSCHRAHASAWNAGMRWNTKGEFITVAGGYPGIDMPEKLAFRNAGGKTEVEYKKALYDRDVSRFATYQRSLCNKCHGKD